MSQRKSAQPSGPGDQDPAVAQGALDASVSGAPALQPQFQDHIGRQLRAVYDDVLSQPVPDRFRELMEKLEQKTGAEE